jgi:hypothetical protein
MPENEQAWEVFILMATQLRVAGMGVIVGLDLAPFGTVCDACNIPQADRESVLNKVVKVSRIALRYWNAKKDE